MKQVKPMLHTDSATPLLVDERQAVAITGLSLSYFRKTRCDGAPGGRTQGPPFVRVGGRVFYRITDLQKWVDELSTQRFLSGRTSHD